MGLDAEKRSALPDSAFAAVYTDVVSKNGRTSRMKVRKFPVHDAAHVRNALARWDQADLPEHVKNAAHAKIMAAAKKYGVA